MALSSDGYAAMAGVVRGIAERHAQGRLALTLEGGYHLGALAESVSATVEALLGSTPPEPRGTSSAGGKAIADAAARLRRYWKLP
jgi:acetoin utilization deacetylase AcuC-like enzyme